MTDCLSLPEASLRERADGLTWGGGQRKDKSRILVSFVNCDRVKLASLGHIGASVGSCSES